MNYFDSKIPWIQKLPYSWKIVPLFFVADENKTKNKNQNENVLSLSYGKIIKRDLSKNFGLLPKNFDAYQEVDKGFIIIRSTDLQNDKKSLRVGLAKENGVITSAYIGLSPKSNIYPDYLFYYLNMCDLKKVFYSLGGGLRQSLRFEEFRRFPVILPSLNEQKLISFYLDKKTEKIDFLIKKIEKKIKLLKEQRTAIINEYVTKGLDQSVDMRNSGIEWIGEIPQDWVTNKLKNVATIEFSSIDRHQYKEERRVSICHYPDAYKNEYIHKETKLSFGTCSDYEFDKFSLQKGDIVLTKDSESPDDIGIPTFVLDELSNTVCGYHLSLIRVKNNLLSPEFLYRFIESKCSKDYFFISSNGITRYGLGKSSIGSLVVPFPRKDMQEEIIKRIRKISKFTEKSIFLLKNKISLLKEYRQSLISSAVTGKIQITEDML